MTTENEQDDSALRHRIQTETATIGFADLAFLYAKGSVVAVHPELNLVDVAVQVSRDNSELIADLMQRRLIHRVTDDIARQWFDENAVVLASVVSPWVLVQVQKTNGSKAWQ